MARARRVDAKMTRWLAGMTACLWLAVGGLAQANGGSGLSDDSCMADTDCADGFACELGPTATADCPPGAGDCEPTPAEPRTGECRPQKMTCETDGDCAAGLSCEHHADNDCAVAARPGAADGGVPVDSDPCEPSEPSPGECEYHFVRCEKDNECDKGLVCTALGTASACSSSGAAPCMPGQECPSPVPEEETCTEITQFYCFPPRADCDNDDDCDDGTRCVALPDDAKEDPPPVWEGATALCLPEAIALVLEGRVDASGDASSTGSDANGASRDEASSTGGGAPKAGATKAADATDDTTSDVVEDDGGCAVSEPGARSDGRAWLPLLLGAMALVARRRPSSESGRASSTPSRR